VLAAASTGLFAPARPAFAALDAEELLKPGPLEEMSMGAQDAPVAIIEYASLTCPHCAAFHADTLPALKEKYVDTGKARFIFREFPFDDAALVAFMLARCAGPNRYFAMVDVLFAQQAIWTAQNRNVLDELFKIARLAGFTETTFRECIANEEIAKGVREVKDRAALEFGVRSTPTFFINGEQLNGNQPIERFDEVIASVSG
jgi:protein-disulfide isomerase